MKKLNNKTIKDKVIISISKTKKISLEEEFKKYKGKNLAKEFSWDTPAGNEIL